MFKRLASEALGLSDIGVIVPAADFNKVDADDYLFSEDGEKIYFLIKSKKDEYCFTNLALVHVDGESAVSSKRVIRRYDWLSHRISHVTLETAGTIDMDVEIKFHIGEGAPFSIDVRKNFIEQLKDLYKALHSIGKLQERDEQARAHAMECLGVTGQMFKLGQEVTEEQVSRHYLSLLNTVNSVVLDKLSRKDFGGVFERYIQN
ncbi:PH domain-containing protein [Pelomonas sp. UHG3]|uniref:PH domain-containing protein n=1 Tax=Roseateles hydrophilus TaxID=2975054 RepID=A0ACC6CC53_9BURK|nr:PH domain-containing protein [Pelomonas sp. UHG3]MCY4745850.1 PH domain-containing protein [Pelomonas sp. UHG3]